MWPSRLCQSKLSKVAWKGRERGWRAQTQSVSLFQFVAGGDPLGGDAVCSLPVVIEECGGPAAWALHRHLP